jgi:2-polyprenyl-6-methoxyphenol hydroxylase-like FAD-dependent oxidoreductase
MSAPWRKADIGVARAELRKLSRVEPKFHRPIAGQAARPGRIAFGRVTLIGDAAHPMQPIGSQAGSQAIIDARSLTKALLATSEPVEALKRYDGERRPVMNDITLRNRGFGPEAAMQLVEERAPHRFVRIEDVISRQELDSIANSFSAAAGLDVETVNGRPSFVRPVHQTLIAQEENSPLGSV